MYVLSLQDIKEIYFGGNDLFHIDGLSIKIFTRLEKINISSNKNFEYSFIIYLMHEFRNISLTRNIENVSNIDRNTSIDDQNYENNGITIRLNKMLFAFICCIKLCFKRN